MATMEEIRKEVEPFIGTVVLDLGFQLGILHSVRDDVDQEDYYYEIENEWGERQFQSCVGRIIRLKGVLPDEEYNYIENCFKLNKDFRVNSEDLKEARKKAEEGKPATEKELESCKKFVSQFIPEESEDEKLPSVYIDEIRTELIKKDQEKYDKKNNKCLSAADYTTFAIVEYLDRIVKEKRCY